MFVVVQEERRVKEEDDEEKKGLVDQCRSRSAGGQQLQQGRQPQLLQREQRAMDDSAAM